MLGPVAETGCLAVADRATQLPGGFGLCAGHGHPRADRVLLGRRRRLPTRRNAVRPGAGAGSVAACGGYVGRQDQVAVDRRPTGLPARVRGPVPAWNRAAVAGCVRAQRAGGEPSARRFGHAGDLQPGAVDGRDSSPPSRPGPHASRRGCRAGVLVRACLAGEASGRPVAARPSRPRRRVGDRPGGRRPADRLECRPKLLLPDSTHARRRRKGRLFVQRAHASLARPDVATGIRVRRGLGVRRLDRRAGASLRDLLQEQNVGSRDRVQRPAVPRAGTGDPSLARHVRVPWRLGNLDGDSGPRPSPGARLCDPPSGVFLLGCPMGSERVLCAWAGEAFVAGRAAGPATNNARLRLRPPGYHGRGAAGTRGVPAGRRSARLRHHLGPGRGPAERRTVRAV